MSLGWSRQLQNRKRGEELETEQPLLWHWLASTSIISFQLRLFWEKQTKQGTQTKRLLEAQTLQEVRGGGREGTLNGIYLSAMKLHYDWASRRELERERDRLCRAEKHTPCTVRKWTLVRRRWRRQQSTSNAEERSVHVRTYVLIYVPSFEPCKVDIFVNEHAWLCWALYRLRITERQTGFTYDTFRIRTAGQNIGIFAQEISFFSRRRNIILCILCSLICVLSRLLE